MWIPLCLIVLASLVIIYFFKKSTSLEKEVLSLRLEKEELKLYARELEVLQGVDAGKLHEREQLAQQFKILSYEALEQTQKKFLEGAKGQLDQAFTVAVAPIRDPSSFRSKSRRIRKIASRRSCFFNRAD